MDQSVKMMISYQTKMNQMYQFCLLSYGQNSIYIDRMTVESSPTYLSVRALAAIESSDRACPVPKAGGAKYYISNYIVMYLYIYIYKYVYSNYKFYIENYYCQ